MVRVKQFADDLAISKKQAKDLINKGRNRKDGGSQILESVMSDTDKKKKKKKSKNENKKLSPFSRDGKHRTFELTEEMISGRGRMPVIKMEKYNPEDMIGGRGRAPVLEDMDIDPRMIRRNKGGSNVTKVNTDKLSKAQMGQFKNIQNDAVSGKISPEEAQRKIRKMLLIKRKDGGGFPDLTGDGKVTKKDILKGRGVPGFSRGGGIAIQGLGFKGVR